MWVNFATQVCDSFVVSNPWDVLKEFNLDPAHVIYCAYKKNEENFNKLLNVDKKLKLHHVYPAIIKSLEIFIPTLDKEEAMAFSKKLGSIFCQPAQSLIADYALDIIRSGQKPGSLFNFFDLQYKLQGIQERGNFSDPASIKLAQQEGVASCQPLLFQGGIIADIASSTFDLWYNELKLHNIANTERKHNPFSKINRPKI